MIEYSIFSDEQFLFSTDVDGQQFVYAEIPLFKWAHPQTDLPRLFITIKPSPSMRFRHSEKNTARDAFFRSFGIGTNVAPLELIHSKNVFAVGSAESLRGKTGDGIITVNRELVPTITIADCMPIYLSDPVSGCFGVLHSGYRGTGIVKNALRLAAEKYHARAEDFFAVMGPHIHSCCYTVDKERAAFFAENFTPSCIEHPDSSTDCDMLSLAEANRHLLEQCGVPNAHIIHCTDCTCCNPRLGSFRREAASLPDSLPLEEKTKRFTAMAAFIHWA